MDLSNKSGGTRAVALDHLLIRFCMLDFFTNIDPMELLDRHFNLFRLFLVIAGF